MGTLRKVGMIGLIGRIKSEAPVFIMYIICAGIATIVDVGSLYYLTAIIGIHYLWSAAIAYSLGMATNYTLNKVFSFKNKSKKIARQFMLFAIVAIIGLLLNQIIMWLLVEYGGLYFMTAKMISICIVVLWSYYGHKKLTFGVYT